MPSAFEPTDPLAWTPDATWLRPPEGDGPWVRSIMISTLDGSATLEGRSGTLSGPADRHVMRLLRATSDAVLVGAGTARQEDYGSPRPAPEFAAWRQANGMSPAPRLALVSRRLAIHPDARLFAAGDGERPLVMTSGSPAPAAVAAMAAVAEVVVLPDLTPDTALTAMRERGLARTVCEGGPHWLRDMLAADAVDEFWLTVSPLVIGGVTAGIVRGSPLPVPERMALLGIARSEDFVFLRYGRPAS